ncbi:MAG: hypothetical protein UY06_C0047G0013, partial [Candidatus Amesbacteria bacterium GW2011_GWA2_47_70]
RRQVILDLFATGDASVAAKFLSDNNIRYLYLPQVAFVRPRLSETALGMTKLFENSQVAIWARSILLK